MVPMDTWWVPVHGFGCYEVSNTAVVRRADSGFRLKGDIDKHGYHRVVLYGGGLRKQFLVHRLVAVAFVGLQPTPAHQINHIDGNKSNNVPGNLEWVTCGENHSHAYRIGLRHGNHGGLKGSRNGRAKITPDQVREIRTLAGQMSQEKIGGLFGLSQSATSSIIRRQTWQDVI